MSDRRRVGVVLANLGTPDEPTPAAVRRYLREFLSDGRVIEVPKLVWFFILRLFILPLRPKRVAHAYASIWQGDSPMRLILLSQVEAMQKRLSQAYPSLDITVKPGMSYGNPALRKALTELQQSGCNEIVVLPLFPQHSATSTGPVIDQVASWLQQQRNIPSMHIVRDYHVHPAYIAALAETVREHWATHGRADKLLFSFHGIPQPYADKGDPYPAQCHATANAVVAALGLGMDEWAISFQSRFGLQEWVKPYTDELLKSWGSSGVGSVQVLCPAFSADCLETLEEIAVENHETFTEAGGKRYEYIPALNARTMHLDAIEAILRPQVQAAAACCGSAAPVAASCPARATCGAVCAMCESAAN